MKKPYTKKEHAAIMSKLSAVTMQLTGSTIKERANHAPHVVVNVGSMDVSICYFVRVNSWRMFYPHPAPWDQQTRIARRYPCDVVTLIEKLRCCSKT